jgi:hypothetical protein
MVALEQLQNVQLILIVTEMFVIMETVRQSAVTKKIAQLVKNVYKVFVLFHARVTVYVQMIKRAFREFV